MRTVTGDRLGQRAIWLCILMVLVMVLGCMMVDGQDGLHRVLWWDCEVVAGSDLELYCSVPWACCVMTLVCRIYWMSGTQEATWADSVVYPATGEDEAVECDWSLSRFLQQSFRQPASECEGWLGSPGFGLRKTQGRSDDRPALALARTRRYGRSVIHVD